MARIVSLGSGLQDIFLVDRDDFASTSLDGRSIFGQINIGTKVDIDKVSYSTGGGGTNSAVTFARHGHEAIFMGTLAHDAAGDAVVATLDDEGVDTSYINFTRGNTGCSVILLDAKSGERTILTHRGVSAKNDHLKPSDLDYIQPDWLYASTLGGNMELLLEFFEKAHSLGAKVMFNPGILELKQKKQLVGLLSEVDILIVNKREAASIVPGQILTELASRLHNYVPTVIITDGAMGAIAVGPTESYRFGIYEDLKVKDTTGAGDAMGAGFLAHFAAGHSFKSSLVFGSANSTSVVSKLGAKAGILNGNEKLHLMPIQKL